MDPKFGVMRLMSLFRRVRNEAPGILYIRDLDLITVDRERTNSPELIQLTTQFLICFDGYYIGSETRPTQRKIFTLGSVSDLRRMDPACLRSGRFEWIVNLRKPTLGERKFLFLNNASKGPVKS
jgi:SpoVK/Ycf46/Vps4 family AAA+-type ATPase